MAKTSNLGFSRKSTAEQVTDGLDLSGQTIVVTGVASGLGLEAMRVLALRGAHVVGLDRTLDAAEQACASVEGQTTAFACDLADPNSIVTCAKAINKKFKTLDVILTNAGVMAPPQTVIEGYTQPLELQFAVNFLGHYVLINRLMSRLKKAPSARLALVASEGYVTAPKKEGIDFDNLDCSQGYDALVTYGQSKLAVMLMNRVLAERLSGSNITSNTIHPGVIRTNLASDSQDFKVKLISMFAGPWTRTIAQGAATHCFVATHPSLDGVSGQHFADCQAKEPEGHALNIELGRTLMDKAEELAKGYLVKW